MMPKLRRIRRWLWNGAVVVSLVMTVVLLVVWVSTIRLQFSLNYNGIKYDLILDVHHPVYKIILFSRQDDRRQSRTWPRLGWHMPFGSIEAPWLEINLSAMMYLDGRWVPAPTVQHGGPLWLPVGVTAILPTLWLILYYRNRRKRLPNHCQTCGYNLTGTLAAGRSECPECGAAVDDGAQTT